MKELKENIIDTVIVGGGPAGISASIQLKRLGTNPILIEKDQIGGSLLNANLVENYLGFPEGISGKKLVSLIVKQFECNNINAIFSEVKNITKKRNFYEILFDNKKFFSRSVIVATGATPKRVGLPKEEKMYKIKKLFYEIKEIPMNIKSKKFVIIGGGDAAFDYAQNLSEKGNDVTILSKSKPKCLDILMKRAEKNKNIKIFTDIKVLDFKYTENNITLICSKGITVNCDYIIVAVGKKPNTVILDKTTIINKLIDNKLPGLYLVGDTLREKSRHLGIAVGDGLLAAIKTKEYLGEQNGNNK